MVAIRLRFSGWLAGFRCIRTISHLGGQPIGVRGRGGACNISPPCYFSKTVRPIEHKLGRQGHCPWRVLRVPNPGHYCACAHYVLEKHSGSWARTWNIGNWYVMDIYHISDLKTEYIINVNCACAFGTQHMGCGKCLPCVSGPMS